MTQRHLVADVQNNPTQQQLVLLGLQHAYSKHNPGHNQEADGAMEEWMDGLMSGMSAAKRRKLWLEKGFNKPETQRDSRKNQSGTHARTTWFQYEASSNS